jgi:hypothetical protein
MHQLLQQQFIEGTEILELNLISFLLYKTMSFNSPGLLTL